MRRTATEGTTAEPRTWPRWHEFADAVLGLEPNAGAEDRVSERYPLSWPEGWKRTAPSARIRAQFGKSEQRPGTIGPIGVSKKRLSIADAVQRVAYELERMGVDQGDIIISTNLKLNVYGIPRGDIGEPIDPGAAVYWTRQKRQECMAIDRYNRVADNIAAIAATLEAMRAIERHGGGEILGRAFQGFAALPERAGGRGWREILGFDKDERPSGDAIRRHFTGRVQDVHPDKPGGDRDKFEELIWARDAALREIGATAEAAKT
jgi:hypothetical protein